MSTTTGTLDELREQAMAGGSTAALAEDLHAYLDRDANDIVSRDEFMTGLATPSSGLNQFGKVLSTVLDVDGGGRVTREEVEDILSSTDKTEAETEELARPFQQA